MPSPSDCSAEIFWPDSLKTYRTFVQQSSFLKSQNYLETLLASRQGLFPLEVTDTSLGLYLGVKGGSRLPAMPQTPALELSRDATVCTGPLVSGQSGPEACQGFELEWKNGDALLPLEGLEVLSAQDLEIEAQGILGQLPGAQPQGVTIRRGKLLLSFRLANRFWNAAFPLALPLPGIKMSPHPFEPDLYDVDLTALLLKKLPVAYHLDNQESVSYEEYQASPDKGRLKVLPYFFNIARSGSLPDQLSLNEIYGAISELRAHTKPSPKKDDPAQRALLEKLLDKISVSAQLHPHRLLHKNLYVEFSQDPESNLFRTDFHLNQLRDWEVLATAPIKIDRLFSPGFLDIIGMKGELGLYLHHQNTSSLSLDQLDIELGPLEYLRADPEKPGLFAVLGGRIRSEMDPVSLHYLHQPALSVEGTTTGAEVSLNVRLEALALRLPQLGRVTVSGHLRGQVKLVPKVEGDSTRWVIEPHSVKLALSDVDLRTESGLHWQNAELEITDRDEFSTGLRSNEPGYLALHFRFPNVEGGHFRSFRIEGGLPLLKGNDGLYDLKATLQSVATRFTLHAEKHNGVSENWALDLTGRHLPESSHFTARLNGVQNDPMAKIQRLPIENLLVKFDREEEDGKSSYGFQLKADRLDFDRLDLRNLHVGLGLVREETKAGVIRWTVPELDFKANRSGWSKKGWVRGPVWITSKATEKNPLSLEVDKNSKILNLRNLNLHFGVTGLTDSKFAKLTENRIIGVDIDGRLRGHWKMDFETFKGSGQISISGDGQGDVHFRGTDGMPLSKPHPDDPTLRVGTPVLSNTEWTMRRMDGIDFENRWIRGQFHLSTLIDPSVARVFGFIFNNNLVLSWKFNHDHLPFSAEGFTRKINQYLAKKAYDERREAKQKEAGQP